MIQVEAITWIKGNKPDKDGWYIATFIGIKNSFTQIVYYSVDWGWTCSTQDIIAYSELPQAYDPTAKTFNFMTALVLWREGKSATSSESGCEYRLQCYESSDAWFEKYIGDGVWHPKNPDIAEIDGLWIEV